MNHGSSLPPWKAVPAMAALIRDPNDTAQVFTIIQALSFGTLRRMTRRYRRTESGRAILRERRSLLPALDRAALFREDQLIADHANLRRRAVPDQQSCHAVRRDLDAVRSDLM